MAVQDLTQTTDAEPTTETEREVIETETTGLLTLITRLKAIDEATGVRINDQTGNVILRFRGPVPGEFYEVAEASDFDYRVFDATEYSVSFKFKVGTEVA